MKSIWIGFFFFISIQLWGQNMCLQKENLLETDRQFASLSEKNGFFIDRRLRLSSVDNSTVSNY